MQLGRIIPMRRDRRPRIRNNRRSGCRVGKYRGDSRPKQGNEGRQREHSLQNREGHQQAHTRHQHRQLTQAERGDLPRDSMQPCRHIFFLSLGEEADPAGGLIVPFSAERCQNALLRNAVCTIDVVHHLHAAGYVSFSRSDVSVATDQMKIEKALQRGALRPALVGSDPWVTHRSWQSDAAGRSGPAPWQSPHSARAV